MKKLILNILVFTFFLVVLSTAVVNAGLDIFAVSGITYLCEDPNESQPEAVFMSGLVNYLDDANEPKAESVFIDDANGPQPESI